MPAVRRFRPLGQVQPVRHKTSEEEKKQTEEVHVHKKEVKRFQPLSDQRRRNDKKHRYPLRVANGLWQKVWELSLNCGSTASGASLNVILIKLISYALDDEVIVNKIQDEFPNRDEFIKIRSWRREK